MILEGTCTDTVVISWEFPKIGDPNIRSTLTNRILIIRTPKQGYVLFFGNSQLRAVEGNRFEALWDLFAQELWNPRMPGAQTEYYRGLNKYLYYFGGS